MALELDISKLGQNNRRNRFSGSIKEFLSKDISFRADKFSAKVKNALFTEFSILFEAGLDIKSILEVVRAEVKDKKNLKVFEHLYSELINGSTLSQAFKKTGKFTSFDYTSIKIGEEAGSLNAVFNDLALYYSDKVKLKRQLINAVSYPSLVMLTALGAVYFMLTYMVPMFSEIFLRSGKDLPVITKTIINISSFVSGKFIYFFIFLLTVIITDKYLSTKEFYKEYKSNILLKVPIVGEITYKSFQISLFQSLSLLTNSNVPLIQSLVLCKEMIHFYPIQKAMDITHNNLLEGNSLYKGLLDSKIFSKQILTLVKIGEEANQLPHIFSKINKMLSDELNHKIVMLNNFLEPLLIMFIGVFVAIILISMYLPIFQMGANIY